VYDIQDLWPDTLVATGMIRKGGMMPLLDRICRLIYNKSSRLTVLSPGFKAKLVDRGVPPEKIEVIYNWTDESHVDGSLRFIDLSVEAAFKGKFNVVFAGSLGKAQGLESVLSAASKVLHSLPQVQFTLVGSGVEEDRLKSETARMRLTNVRFLPWCSKDQMATLFKLSDVLLVHLKDDPLFSITIPSKTQAALAAGKPVLMAVRGDASDLIKSANAGICVEPGSPDALADAVKEFYFMPPSQRKQLGENGRRFYCRELTMSKGVEKFDSIFRHLADESKTNRK
jgi:colanic acid biosynthesis glycosyl transferase WcaI